MKRAISTAATPAPRRRRSANRVPFVVYVLLVVMVQVRCLVEIFLHGLGRLLRGRVGAVPGQVAQQVLQGLQLLADLVVAVLEDGDRLVVAGSRVDQGVAHGALYGWFGKAIIVAGVR